MNAPLLVAALRDQGWEIYAPEDICHAPAWCEHATFYAEEGSEVAALMEEGWLLIEPGTAPREQKRSLPGAHELLSWAMLLTALTTGAYAHVTGAL